MSNIAKENEVIDAEIVTDDDYSYTSTHYTKMSFSERFIGSIGILGVLAYFAYGAVQLYAGFSGIGLYFNSVIVAGLVITFSLIFRFSFVLTLGAYYYATQAWGWTWYVALIFVMPGLLFMIPGILMAMLGTFRR
jgi:hypothetical protein